MYDMLGVAGTSDLLLSNLDNSKFNRASLGIGLSFGQTYTRAIHNKLV